MTRTLNNATATPTTWPAHRTGRVALANTLALAKRQEDDAAGRQQPERRRRADPIDEHEAHEHHPDRGTENIGRLERADSPPESAEIGLEAALDERKAHAHEDGGRQDHRSRHDEIQRRLSGTQLEEIERELNRLVRPEVGARRFEARQSREGPEQQAD